MEVSTISQSALCKFDYILLLPALAEHESDVPIRRWIDERGRVRIWIANTGAHHRGVLSLDYRLRDVPVIQSQTIKILQRLQALLETLEEVLVENGRESTEEEEEALKILEDQLDQDQKIADLDFNQSEVSHIFRTVVETVTQLYQISMTISPLSEHDRLIETEDLDFALQAVHEGNGESILSKVSLTNTNDDHGTKQILLCYYGTDHVLPVPKVLLARMVTVGEIRAMVAEFFRISDMNQIRLIYRGRHLKIDSQHLENPKFEQSKAITCMILRAQTSPHSDDFS